MGMNSAKKPFTVMQFRKKPIVIEAVQWLGFNLEEFLEFVPKEYKHEQFYNKFTNSLQIKTLEGVMTVSLEDYVIKGVNGEFYPCKPDIFQKTYDEIGNNSPEDSWQAFCKNRGIPLNTRESTEIMFAWKSGYDRGINERSNN